MLKGSHVYNSHTFAEEEAIDQGKFEPSLIFRPLNKNWSSGYKSRNMLIARASDKLLCITVDTLPKDYTGMRFNGCYHCLRRGFQVPHVKSGGCWTMWYTYEKLKKPIWHVVIPNYKNRLDEDKTVWTRWE